LKQHTDKSPLGHKNWWLLAFLSAAIVVSSVSSVDRMAEDDYESLFQRALVTFALARTLNGLISVVQGTEVALTPAGVGVTLTPGQILDPVNDLVERFSWIMLGATISLGVQQVLLDIGQWWGVRAVLILAGLLLAWSIVQGASSRPGFMASLQPALVKVFLLLVFLRFAVPLALIANETLFDQFLQARYLESSQVIETAGTEIEQASEASADPADQDQGFSGAMGRLFENARETLDLETRVESIRAKAADLIEHLIQLSVVFILQTAVLPLVFLWLLLRLMQWVASRQTGSAPVRG
jgi:hypothetical protein